MQEDVLFECIGNALSGVQYAVFSSPGSQNCNIPCTVESAQTEALQMLPAQNEFNPVKLNSRQYN